MNDPVKQRDGGNEPEDPSINKEDLEVMLPHSWVGTRAPLCVPGEGRVGMERISWERTTHGSRNDSEGTSESDSWTDEGGWMDEGYEDSTPRRIVLPRPPNPWSILREARSMRIDRRTLNVNILMSHLYLLMDRTQVSRDKEEYEPLLMYLLEEAVGGGNQDLDPISLKIKRGTLTTLEEVIGELEELQSIWTTSGEDEGGSEGEDISEPQCEYCQMKGRDDPIKARTRVYHPRWEVPCPPLMASLKRTSFCDPQSIPMPLSAKFGRQAYLFEKGLRLWEWGGSFRNRRKIGGRKCKSNRLTLTKPEWKYLKDGGGGPSRSRGRSREDFRKVQEFYTNRLRELAREEEQAAGELADPKLSEEVRGKARLRLIKAKQEREVNEKAQRETTRQAAMMEDERASTPTKKATKLRAGSKSRVTEKAAIEALSTLRLTPPSPGPESRNKKKPIQIKLVKVPDPAESPKRGGRTRKKPVVGPSSEGEEKTENSSEKNPASSEGGEEDDLLRQELLQDTNPKVNLTTAVATPAGDPASGDSQAPQEPSCQKTCMNPSPLHNHGRVMTEKEVTEGIANLQALLAVKQSEKAGPSGAVVMGSGNHSPIRTESEILNEHELDGEIDEDKISNKEWFEEEGDRDSHEPPSDGEEDSSESGEEGEDDGIAVVNTTPPEAIKENKVKKPMASPEPVKENKVKKQIKQFKIPKVPQEKEKGETGKNEKEVGERGTGVGSFDPSSIQCPTLCPLPNPHPRFTCPFADEWSMRCWRCGEEGHRGPVCVKPKRRTPIPETELIKFRNGGRRLARGRGGSVGANKRTLDTDTEQGVEAKRGRGGGIWSGPRAGQVGTSSGSAVQAAKDVRSQSVPRGVEIGRLKSLSFVDLPTLRFFLAAYEKGTTSLKERIDTQMREASGWSFSPPSEVAPWGMRKILWREVRRDKEGISGSRVECLVMGEKHGYETMLYRAIPGEGAAAVPAEDLRRITLGLLKLSKILEDGELTPWWNDEEVRVVNLEEWKKKRNLNDVVVDFLMNGELVTGILDSGAHGVLVGQEFLKHSKKAYGWAWQPCQGEATMADGSVKPFLGKIIVKVTWGGVSRVIQIRAMHGVRRPLFGMAAIRAFGGVAIFVNLDGFCSATPLLNRRLLEFIPMNEIPSSATLVKGDPTVLMDTEMNGDFLFEMWRQREMGVTELIPLKRREGGWYPTKNLQRMWELHSAYGAEPRRDGEPEHPGLQSTDNVRTCTFLGTEVPIMAKQDCLLEPYRQAWVPIEWKTVGAADGPWVFEEVESIIPPPWVGRRTFVPDGTEEGTAFAIENHSGTPVVIPKGTILGRAWKPDVKGGGERSETPTHEVRTIELSKAPPETDDDVCFPPLPSDPWKEDVIAPMDFTQCEKTGVDVKQLKGLLKEYEDVFAKGRMDIGSFNGPEHTIELTDSRPFSIPFRRKNPIMAEEERKQVQSMLDSGIIRPSSSPFSSPTVLVKKKGGEWRLCVDYRRLNAKTLPDSYPMPRADDLLEKMAGYKIFSALDLGSAFWQLRMSKQASTYTAFATADGLFEPNRMFFGLRNAPPSFQRTIDSMIAGLPRTSAYLDDLLIFSRTPEEHLKDIEAVLRRLREHGGKLKPDKSVWGAEKLQYLGHLVDEKGISPLDSHVADIKAFPRPQKIKDLKSFLGSVGFYRRFIKDFSAIAKPLTDELRGATGKKMGWNRNAEMQKAFERLKEKLISAPVLRHPNPDLPFTLTTDASGTALGAVLSQTGEDGEEHPVGYYSKRLNPTAERWSATEREFYGVVMGLAHFRHLLLGRKDTRIVTDHIALKYITNMKDTNSKFWRWSNFLEDFAPYTVVHRPGKDNVVADFLSRVPEEEVRRLETESPFPGIQESAYWKAVQDKDSHIKEQKARIERALKTEENKRSEKEDELLERWCIRDGLLFLRQHLPPPRQEQVKLRLQLPEIEVEKMAEKAHHDSLFGHRGSANLEARLRLFVNGPGIRQAAEKVTGSCLTCAKFRDKHSKAIKYLEETFQSWAHIPFTGWSIDLVGPMSGRPTDSKPKETLLGPYQYTLVCTDWATKLVELVPLKDKSSLAVAQALVTHVFARWGIPQFILSDQGGEFTADLLNELMLRCGAQHLFTTPYSAHMNGVVERKNAEVVTTLKIFTRAALTNWHKWLPFVQGTLNAIPSSETHVSPLELATGVPPLPLDMNMIDPFIHLVGRSLPWKTSEARREAMEGLRKWAAERTAATREKALEQRLGERRFANTTTIRMGDFVVLKEQTGGKLDPIRRGPFLVIAFNQAQSKLLVHPMQKQDGFEEKKCKWVSTRHARVVGNSGSLIPFVSSEVTQLWSAMKQHLANVLKESSPLPRPNSEEQWGEKKPEEGMTLRSGKRMQIRAVCVGTDVEVCKIRWNGKDWWIWTGKIETDGSPVEIEDELKDMEIRARLAKLRE